MAKDAILQVKESFTATIDGTIVVFRQGELVDFEHPVVQKYAHYFRTPAVDHPAPKVARIEQATAAPGEKRGR